MRTGATPASRSAFASLQRLYDFSRALGTANLEPSSMSVDVLRQVCTVMRARRAELVLAEPSGIPRRISLDDDGSLRDRADQPRQAIDRHRSDRERRCVPPPRPDRKRRNASYDPIVGRYGHAIVAPIMNGHTAIGAIVAFDRDEELDDFDDDDLRLFETLVAHASASLERARLVEELRYEVDSKSHQATHDMLDRTPQPDALPEPCGAAP